MGPMLPVPASLVWSGKISARGSLLYGLLRSFEGVKGDAFPSMGRIAAKLGITIRQAQRTVAELEKLKLIEVSRRGHQHRGSVYRFLDSDLLRTPEPEALERDERWGDENVTAESDENVADQFRSDENVTGVGDENVTARSDENVTAYERLSERLTKRDSLTHSDQRSETDAQVSEWDRSEESSAGETPTNSQRPTATTARSTDLTPPGSARTPSLTGQDYPLAQKLWVRDSWERAWELGDLGKAPAWGETDKTHVRAICGRSGGIYEATAFMAYAAFTWKRELVPELRDYYERLKRSEKPSETVTLTYILKSLCESPMRASWRMKALEWFKGFAHPELAYFQPFPVDSM